MKLLKNKRNHVILFAVIVIVIASVFVFLSSRQEVTDISYIEFSDQLEKREYRVCKSYS